MDYPLVVAPTGHAYVRDIYLARLREARHVAAWVEEDGNRRVVWRMIESARAGSVQSTTNLCGVPTNPRIAGHHLVWCEMAEDSATVVHLPLSADLTPAGPMTAIPAYAGSRFDHPACAVDRDGMLWVLAEHWRDAACTLRLAYLDNQVWHVDEDLSPDGFCVRPQLVAHPSGLLASWDCYRNGEYRILTARHVSGGWLHNELPAPDGVWETLSTPAFGPDGTSYAARCREHLIERTGGICSHHSRLVVSRRDAGATAWRDVAETDIDFAMNPWMAAYCGLRRFPSLVADAAEAWLLWEEKEDVLSMDPPTGRLCAMQITPQSSKDPQVVIEHSSHFIVAANGTPEKLAVISRPRPARFVEKFPAYLYCIDLGRAAAPRPPDLESNASLPPFEIVAPRRECAHNGYRLFFGDPHLHSRASQDLDGEQDELYYFARDVAALDFAAFTENDFHHFAERLSQAEALRSRRNADVFNQVGVFTTFQGWEFTSRRIPGTRLGTDSHRCVIFPDTEVDICPWYEDGAVLGPRDLVQRFRGRRVLLHHHHPMGYDISDDSLERNIEICSGWWNCMERDDFVRALHKLLGEGFRLGFIGASDNHERNPGFGGALTGVWARENTREAIFDAFWQRRAFATTGIRPYLWFDVSGTVMGSELELTDPPCVHIHVRSDRPITRITVIRDGTEVHREHGSSKEVDLSWQDDACCPGEHYYYVHVRFAGEEVNQFWNCASAYGVNAWTSPVWVRRSKGRNRST